MLGYTQASWDNLSGQEQQPWSSIKSWASLTDIEKEGAAVLGYTDITWDNVSGSEAQPASANKGWAELSVCGDGEGAFVSVPHPQPFGLLHTSTDVCAACFCRPECNCQTCNGSTSRSMS